MVIVPVLYLRYPIDVEFLQRSAIQFRFDNPDGIIVPPYDLANAEFCARSYEGLRQLIKGPLAIPLGGKDAPERQAFLHAAFTVFSPDTGPVFFPRQLPQRFELVRANVLAFREDMWYHYPGAEELPEQGLVGKWTTGG